MARDPLTKVQAKARTARQMVAACSTHAPSIQSEIQAAVEAICALEDRCAELLGAAPTARERREGR